jgi:hypothetical protein
MTMKDYKKTVLVSYLVLAVIGLLAHSCKKQKLSWPPWQNYNEKAVAEADGQDWPRWRGPEGNGVSKETDWNPAALKNGQKILWKTNVGPGYSNISIKDGRLYTMGIKDHK